MVRKLLYLSITLMLLTACADKGREAEELALAIRGDYLASSVITAQCDIVADYGQRIYAFSYGITSTEEEMTLILLEPEELAGMVVVFSEEDSSLSYDGVLLETGTLTEGGITPITAIPALLQAVKTGFIVLCDLETEGDVTRLRIIYRDPDIPAGTGEEITLWMNPETGVLLEGEIAQDGYRVLGCTFTQFIQSDAPNK